MRRNRNLAKLREQLLDATLSRSQSPGFATIIEGHATLPGHKGKHRKLTYTAKSDAGLKRFGWVRKTVNFGQVSSELELQIIAKRSLAQRLAPGTQPLSCTTPGSPRSAAATRSTSTSPRRATPRSPSTRCRPPRTDRRSG